MPVSPEEIYKYLISRGVSDGHAVGILANIKAESGFDPEAFNLDDKGEPASGFFQHRADREEKLLEFLGEEGLANWRGQIDFALQEREGRQYLAQNFASGEEASKAFTRNFERPADKERKAKERAADVILFDDFREQELQLEDGTPIPLLDRTPGTHGGSFVSEEDSVEGIVDA